MQLTIRMPADICGNDTVFVLRLLVPETSMRKSQSSCVIDCRHYYGTELLEITNGRTCLLSG